jgi:hypothetical protein
MSTTKINGDNVDTASIATLSAAQTLTNKTIGPTAESVTVTASAPSATTNFDLATQAVQYYTSNATNNFTLNIRGNSGTTLNSYMAIGSSLSFALIITVGSTGYYPSAFQIDGSAVTPKWLGTTAPNSGNANTLSIYTLTVIKTANNAFLTFGSVSVFS